MTTYVDAATMFDDYQDAPATPEVEKGLKRDRHDRPMIVPPGGGEKVPYTRMSTLATMLDHMEGIHRWEMRLLARGLGMSPDLVGMLAGVPPISGNKRLDSVSNAQIDPIIERALDRAGRDVKADYGTAVHALTDPGVPREYIPTPEMASDIEAFDHRMRTATQELCEVFVVNDELQAAGTFDGSWRWLGLGHVLGDKKTGKFKPLACAVQLAGYRGSVIYDPVTDERSPLPDDLSQEWVATIHIPYGEKKCDVYFMDLPLAYEAAKLAARVRDVRTWGNQKSEIGLFKRVDPAVEGEQWLATQIEAARSLGELQHLWDRYGAFWTVEHKAQASARGLK